MRPIYQMQRLVDVAASLRIARKAAFSERLPRKQLEALQQQGLERLVRHAALHAPWHRARLASLLGAGKPISLATLPRMDKQSMMANFDEAVCDPRLALTTLVQHTDDLSRDELLAGEFRTLTTSGTSGIKAYFCFGRRAWRANMSYFPRCASAVGFTPRLPRWKIAQLTAGGPLHATYRLARSVDLGVHRTLLLKVADPVSSLAASLQRFRPDAISGYPSVLAMLADEQLAGRLDIGPRYCFATAEQCTTSMRERIQRAWESPLFDVYATTETGGPLAFECSAHNGMHIFEDRVLLEVVDSSGRPVPNGTRGHHLLLTVLDNLIQPIIRYELDDMLTVDAAPCSCGRTTRRIVSIEGRTGDILYFKSSEGSVIPIHPSRLLEHIGEQTWVRQWQVVTRPGELEIAIVAHTGADAPTESIIQSLVHRIQAAGAEPPKICVSLVDAIPRSPGGKHTLVRKEGNLDDLCPTRN